MYSKNMFEAIKKLFSNKKNIGRIQIGGIGKAKTKKAEIRARVYRASEGKWYDLGVIATYKRNPFQFLLLKVGQIKNKLLKKYGN